MELGWARRDAVDGVGIVWLGIGMVIFFVKLKLSVQSAVRQDSVWICDRTVFGVDISICVVSVSAASIAVLILLILLLE